MKKLKAFCKRISGISKLEEQLELFLNNHCISIDNQTRFEKELKEAIALLNAHSNLLKEMSIKISEMSTTPLKLKRKPKEK